MKSLAYFFPFLIVLFIASSCEKGILGPVGSTIPDGSYEFSLELDGYFGYFCEYEGDGEGGSEDYRGQLICRL